MTFVDIITSHASWKAKFKIAIETKETLDVSLIAKDNCCDLGQWLYNADSIVKYGNLESYKACVITHADFHKEAANIATLINEAKYEEATRLIGYASGYAKLSNAVSASIRRMSRDVI
jgi:methyl-accepting chemotaxis protein